MRGDEGVLFLADFNALKAAAENSPEFLKENWGARDDLQKLCDRLEGSHRSFLLAEEWTAVPFTPHVSLEASAARRDYDARWAREVARVADREFLALFEDILARLSISDLPEDGTVDPISRDIEIWKSNARVDARNLTYAFDCLADQRANDDHNDFEWVDEAQLSWDRLTKIVGLDLQGAFWRRRAIPHVLFPTHVSNRYGQSRDSIYRRLLDAGRAFTFGAPLAALAMQRAVLEELLEHWGAPEGRIRDAGLPSLAHDARADRLKRIANTSLHGDPARLEPHDLEREIVKNFVLLRELIEATPEGRR